MKLFILAGQSNMAGRGDFGDLPRELRSPNKKVLFRYLCSFGADSGPPFQSAGWHCLEACSKHPSTPGRHFGPEMGLAPFMLEYLAEETIAIVKHGRGGTNLHTDWNPDAKSGRRCYTALLRDIQSGIAELRSRGHDPIPAGLFWYQGEGDSLTREHAEVYEGNLQSLIARLRRDLVSPNLPFVAAGILPGARRHPRTGEPWMVFSDRIRAAIDHVAATDPHGASVPTDGLTTGDPAHLDGAGLLVVGRNMAKAWTDLAASG